jgi:hypothetical protein
MRLVGSRTGALVKVGLRMDEDWYRGVGDPHWNMAEVLPDDVVVVVLLLPCCDPPWANEGASCVPAVTCDEIAYVADSQKRPAAGA